MKKLKSLNLRKLIFPSFFTVTIVALIFIFSLTSGFTVFNADPAFGYGGGGLPPATTTPAPTTEAAPTTTTLAPTTTAAPSQEGTVSIEQSVDDQGTFQQTVIITDTEGTMTLEIDEGIQATYTDQNNQVQPVTEITAAPIDTNTLPANPNVDVMIPYNFGPDGATFSEPVTITLVVPAELLFGKNLNDLTIGFFNETTGQWVELTGINMVMNADGSYTISGETDHFTLFAVYVKIPAPEPAPTTTAPAPSQTTGTQPTATTNVQPTQTTEPGANQGPVVITIKQTTQAVEEKMSWTLPIILAAVAVVFFAIFLPIYFRRD